MASTSDIAFKAEKKREELMASIPSEYLVDLSSVGIQPLPKEPIPRPVSSQQPWLLKKHADYPSERVIDIPEKVLDAKTLEITEKSVHDLLLALTKGELSSTDALEAFIKRAVLAHQLTNCCVQFLIPFARDLAKKADDHLAKTGKTLGPLHGLPISLKDQHSIKGFVTVMGSASRVDQVAQEDSVIAQILMKAGAVPFVFTNVPQTLMRPETDNYVFGRTVNPFGRAFSPGGSSGGEGALVALKGSPLGTGTDIGGSVRFPSAFNGLYGLRPSWDRVPYAGSANTMLGFEAVKSSIGPLCRTLAGVKTYFETVLAGKPWMFDAQALVLPFNHEAYNACAQKSPSDLKIAMLWTDGLVHPTPPILRALNEVKEKLIKAGVTVVDWKPIREQEVPGLVNDLYRSNGGVDFEETAKEGSEPLAWNMIHGGQAEPAKVFTTSEMWALNQRKFAYQQEFFDAWQAAQIDALIAPVAPLPAWTHDSNGDVMYTGMFNVLNRPALACPAGFVDPALDGANQVGKSVPFHGEADEAVQNEFDAQKWKGLPTAFQIVGSTQRDEELLGIAESFRRAGILK
ncbi:unnamed protein product [Sympodiomycopsis kandeliae]